MTFPNLLTLIVFSPLLGILVLAFTPKTKESAIKLIGVLATIPALILTLYLYIAFQLGAKLSDFAEKVSWMQFANPEVFNSVYSVNYELRADGFSILMLVLTALLSTLAAIASIHIKKEWKGYFILFLLLQIGMFGVFAAGNLILFFIFFEITLIPTFFLIGKWGYAEKEKAALSFLIYNGIGSAILLIVIMFLFAKIGTTNIEALMSILSNKAILSESTKMTLLIALIIAFGVKLPIFPLHSWMVRVHVEAPPSIVMLHAGILLKIGAYGLIKFGIGFFPEQFQSLATWIAILGVINLLYGAFLALIQTDFKKVLAYSSISHMGIVLIGLGAINSAGVQGAIFQVVSHGLLAALLFWLVSIFYQRYETTKLAELGGMARAMPVTAGFLLVGALGSLGLPGMSGFIAEFMSFLGLFKSMPILAAVGCLGIILTAVYLLRAVLSITFGEGKTTNKVKDMETIEKIPAVILVCLIVAIGVYPDLIASGLTNTIETIVIGLGG
ncbi:complex I subunit 4 family protein [Cytobacillus horneckiae]|uniref:complex I subunit 4 family protein n=1 Tax=Cytobacillus horneckiae TaxID=549687 RepID=UPI003D20C0A2